MIHEERWSAPETVAELRAEHAAALQAAVESVGVDAATERTGLSRETIEAVAAGEVPEIGFDDAAAIQSLDPDAPDAETVVEMACDHLLLGMSTAVLDVDTVAGNVDLDLTPKEVQQKLERRAPMTFDEFVAVQHFIARRQ